MPNVSLHLRVSDAVHHVANLMVFHRDRLEVISPKLELTFRCLMCRRALWNDYYVNSASACQAYGMNEQIRDSWPDATCDHMLKPLLRELLIIDRIDLFRQVLLSAILRILGDAIDHDPSRRICHG